MRREIIVSALRTFPRMIAIALCMTAVVGCGSPAQTACKLIDVAHHACAVIEFRDEAGQVRRVEVTRDELVGTAMRAEARRHATDGGAP